MQLLDELGLGWTGAAALFFSSALFAILLFLSVRLCRGTKGSSAASRRFRCSVPGELRERLEAFVALIPPNAILDGARKGVRKAGLPFDWNVVTHAALPASERAAKEVTVSLTHEVSVERTAPTVWSALVEAEVKSGGGKAESAHLVVCHLSEKRLFDGGDALLERLEKELAKAVKGIAPWNVQLQQQ
jgi:hypothetical protein